MLSINGMSATDPIHQTIKYIAGTEEAIEKGSDYKTTSYDTMTAKEVQDALRGAAFPYQWGVYTTAYARKQLQDAIKLCGDKIVYCDTDSVKTLGPVPIEKLNDELKKAAIRAGAYADDMNGKRHYIGLFEEDAFYTRFITQGAKRYAYIKGGKMGVTCAGVTKTINEETGVPFAVEELRCLKRFKPGMIWRKAGGTMAVYNDNDDYDYTDPETGRTVHIGKNVAIVPTTYKMTYSRDYAALLNEISLYSEYKEERS